MTNGNGKGNPMVPSQSTVIGGGLGVSVSTLICFVLSYYGIPVPGEVGAAIGAVATALLGYFFSGGKRADTV